MKLAIMQPYFLPYIGYFQLIAAADVFVIYDNIKYTKKGWINRNRMLLNGSDAVFSLPLKKASDSLFIDQREISPDFDRNKMMNQFRGAYAHAPFFPQTWRLIERIVKYGEDNLFRFLYHSIRETCHYLDIRTELRISSEIAINHDLKSQEKVIALCKAMGADIYINSIGGLSLYEKGEFATQGIELRFLRPEAFEYPQFGPPFVPWLSIIDVLMFNSVDLLYDRIYRRFELL